MARMPRPKKRSLEVELAQDVMALVRDQVVRLAERFDGAELVRSKKMRDMVNDLVILADMAKGVFEHLPRDETPEADAEQDPEPEE